MTYTDHQLWNACAEILAADPRPLDVARVATAADMREVDVITALIRCAVPPRYVQFRFPPLPRAAITKIVGLPFEAPEQPCEK